MTDISPRYDDDYEPFDHLLVYDLVDLTGSGPKRDLAMIVHVGKTDGKTIYTVVEFQDGFNRKNIDRDDIHHVLNSECMDELWERLGFGPTDTQPNVLPDKPLDCSFLISEKPVEGCERPGVFYLEWETREHLLQLRREQIAISDMIQMRQQQTEKYICNYMNKGEFRSLPVSDMTNPYDRKPRAVDQPSAVSTSNNGLSADGTDLECSASWEEAVTKSLHIIDEIELKVGRMVVTEDEAGLKANVASTGSSSMDSNIV